MTMLLYTDMNNFVTFKFIHNDDAMDIAAELFHNELIMPCTEALVVDVDSGAVLDTIPSTLALVWYNVIHAAP